MSWGFPPFPARRPLHTMLALSFALAGTILLTGCGTAPLAGDVADAAGSAGAGAPQSNGGSPLATASAKAGNTTESGSEANTAEDGTSAAISSGLPVVSAGRQRDVSLAIQQYLDDEAIGARLLSAHATSEAAQYSDAFAEVDRGGQRVRLALLVHRSKDSWQVVSATVAGSDGKR